MLTITGHASIVCISYWFRYTRCPVITSIVVKRLVKNMLWYLLKTSYLIIIPVWYINKLYIFIPCMLNIFSNYVAFISQCNIDSIYISIALYNTINNCCIAYTYKCFMKLSVSYTSGSRSTAWY